MISAKEVKQQIPIPGRKLQLQHQGWPGMDLPETIFRVVVRKENGTHNWKGYIRFDYRQGHEYWTMVIDHNTRTGMMPSFQRDTLGELLDFVQNKARDSLRLKTYEVLEMERV